MKERYQGPYRSVKGADTAIVDILQLVIIGPTGYHIEVFIHIFSPPGGASFGRDDVFCYSGVYTTESFAPPEVESGCIVLRGGLPFHEHVSFNGPCRKEDQVHQERRAAPGSVKGTDEIPRIGAEIGSAFAGDGGSGLDGDEAVGGMGRSTPGKEEESTKSDLCLIHEPPLHYTFCSGIGCA